MLGTVMLEFVNTAPSLPRVWWLTYVSESDVSNGVVIVEAIDFLTACSESRRRGLSPGGEVRGIEIPANVAVYHPQYRNRHYGPEEARKLAELD